MGRHRTATEKVELGEQARAMRAAGKSRREIVAELKIGDDLAKELLRGTPVPDSLRRSRAKDAVRDQARELRAQGLTYPQIAERLGVSRSSCSLWLRDMEHPIRGLAGQERRTAAIRASAARTQVLREQQRTELKAAAGSSLGHVTKRDLVVALAVSYWCEGGKDKPWSRREQIQWMNSDPMLVRLFIEGLRLLGVSDERIKFRVQIHETADEPAARRWWAEQLDWPETEFQRTTFKRHNPKTVRKNCAEDYHGCVTVHVLRSRSLYQLVDGLMRGLAGQPRDFDSGGSMVVAAEAV
jgi:transposase